MLQRNSINKGSLPVMADTYNLHMRRKNANRNGSIHCYPDVTETNLTVPAASPNEYVWKQIKRENNGFIES